MRQHRDAASEASASAVAPRHLRAFACTDRISFRRNRQPVLRISPLHLRR